MLDHLFEIRKQSALEEAEEAELEQRTVTVWEWSERLALLEPGIKVFEDIDSKEQTAATTQGTVEMRARCEEIMKEKKEVFVSPDFNALLQVIFRNSRLALVFVDIGDCDPGDPPTVQEEGPPP
jgi:hypothetical protein